MKSLPYLWLYCNPGDSVSRVGLKKDVSSIGNIGEYSYVDMGRSRYCGDIGGLSSTGEWICGHTSVVGPTTYSQILAATDNSVETDSRGFGSIC